MRFDEQEIGRPPIEEEKSVQHPLILDSIDEPESDHEDDTPTTEVMPRRSTRESRPVDSAAMVFHKLTSQFIVSPPPLKKQPIARRKPNGMRLCAKR